MFLKITFQICKFVLHYTLQITASIKGKGTTQSRITLHARPEFIIYTSNISEEKLDNIIDVMKPALQRVSSQKVLTK